MDNKEARKLVYKLCIRYAVPMIRVKLEEDLGRNIAVFNPNTYVIHFEGKATKKDIIHEFGHYIQHLYHISEDLGEVLSGAFEEYEDSSN